jgi:hypothetical protein
MSRMLNIERFQLLAGVGLAHHVDITVGGPEPAMTSVNISRRKTERLPYKRGFGKLMPIKASPQATLHLAGSRF